MIQSMIPLSQRSVRLLLKCFWSKFLFYVVNESRSDHGKRFPEGTQKVTIAKFTPDHRTSKIGKLFISNLSSF